MALISFWLMQVTGALKYNYRRHVTELNDECRAARALIGENDLAARAEVGESTVRNFEAGRTLPCKKRSDSVRLEGGRRVYCGEWWRTWRSVAQTFR